MKSRFSGIDRLSRSFTPGQSGRAWCLQTRSLASFATLCPHRLAPRSLAAAATDDGSSRAPSMAALRWTHSFVLSWRELCFLGVSQPKAYPAVTGQVWPTLGPPDTLNELEPLAQVLLLCGERRLLGACGELVVFLLSFSSGARFPAPWCCAGSGRCSTMRYSPVRWQASFALR